MNTYVTLLKREVWEHKAFWILPLVVAGLFLATEIFGLGTWLIYPGHAQFSVGNGDLQHGGQAIMGLTMGSAVVFNMFLGVLVFFYLVDCLYGERRDRSILFWKSLPVSDLETVLSKLGAAALVAPLIFFVIMAVTEVVGLILFFLVAAFRMPELVSHLFHPVVLIESWLLVIYGMLVQSLWFLPISGWLLLASAWAKKSPILWAVMPPVAIMIIEPIAFGTSKFLHLLGYRLSVGVFRETFNLDGHQFMVGSSYAESLVTASNVWHVLSSPGMWGGVIVGVVFIGGAVWLRRYREEI